MKDFQIIGIVGGMSPESTIIYYQNIVRRHQAEFGDHSYPRIVIASVSFQKYIDWQHRGQWQQIAEELTKEFRALASAGCDFAILATNTMHKVLPQIRSPIPVLSIIDSVADYALSKNIQSVGLTGTRFTMSDRFYAEGLEKRDLSVVLPTAEEQERIHKIIYEELIAGKINAKSVQDFEKISRELLSRGAGSVLLGCTELAMLVRESADSPKFIDSTRVHSEAAWSLSAHRSKIQL